MPPPKNAYRYLGKVIRPGGIPDYEMFRNLADAKIEISNRYRSGVGVVYTFAYDDMGTTVDLDSISVVDVKDTISAGTTVDLHKVHRDGNVEPSPRYRLTLNERGGVSSVRLRKGVDPI